jgi:hypothetical protein
MGTSDLDLVTRTPCNQDSLTRAQRCVSWSSWVGTRAGDLGQTRSSRDKATRPGSHLLWVKVTHSALGGLEELYSSHRESHLPVSEPAPAPAEAPEAVGLVPLGQIGVLPHMLWEAGGKPETWLSLPVPSSISYP